MGTVEAILEAAMEISGVVDRIQKFLNFPFNYRTMMNFRKGQYGNLELSLPKLGAGRTLSISSHHRNVGKVGDRPRDQFPKVAIKRRTQQHPAGPIMD